VPSVPESLLKKRQAYAAVKAKRQKKILAIKKVNFFFTPLLEFFICCNISYYW